MRSSITAVGVVARTGGTNFVGGANRISGALLGGRIGRPGATPAPGRARPISAARAVSSGSAKIPTGSSTPWRNCIPHSSRAPANRARSRAERWRIDPRSGDTYTRSVGQLVFDGPSDGPGELGLDGRI